MNFYTVSACAFLSLVDIRTMPALEFGHIWSGYRLVRIRLSPDGVLVLKK